MLERYAFKDCDHLSRIVIPDAVDVIRSYSFYGCKRLTSVTLGSGVDSIASNAFVGCTALDTLCCRAVVPPTLARKNCFDTKNYTSATLRNRYDQQLRVAGVFLVPKDYNDKWANSDNE